MISASLALKLVEGIAPILGRLRDAVNCSSTGAGSFDFAFNRTSISLCYITWAPFT